MAPNHSEEPDPTSGLPEPRPDAASVDPVASSHGVDRPPADVPGGDAPADTGSLSLSLLVAPAPAPGPDPAPEPETGRTLPDADLPPQHVSELGRRWPVRQVVGGVPFVASDPLTAARDLAEAAVAGTSGEHVHLANAFSVSLANEFPALAAETFCADGWNLPDGRPISWISQLRRDRPALRQVRGPQFMLDVCEVGVDLGLRHFLLGGAPDVLERLEAALTERFPGIQVVGSFSPAFREPSDAELAERDEALMASGAQVVWVGLGTPKQDREAVRIARSTGLVAVAVGAAFDYAAGTLREAPAWMRRAGFEWLFRLLMEPRRLWRRYLIGNTRFLRVALRRRPHL
jgi:N-acetylglucosaminyldiphosphoundecaprenol N-acetyl-beta-D-mannosaminyltransferase